MAVLMAKGFRSRLGWQPCWGHPRQRGGPSACWAFGALPFTSTRLGSLLKTPGLTGSWHTLLCFARPKGGGGLFCSGQSPTDKPFSEALGSRQLGQQVSVCHGCRVGQMQMMHQLAGPGSGWNWRSRWQCAKERACGSWRTPSSTFSVPCHLSHLSTPNQPQQPHKKDSCWLGAPTLCVGGLFAAPLIVPPGVAAPPAPPSYGPDLNQAVGLLVDGLMQ